MALYRSPQEAMQAPAEEFLYLVCLRDDAPDFLAVVDAEKGQIVHELPMPNIGDELHHFGWNRCSSACHGPDRSHLIVPGFGSSRFHIVSVADDPRRPRMEKVIEPERVAPACVRASWMFETILASTPLDKISTTSRDRSWSFSSLFTIAAPHVLKRPTWLFRAVLVSCWVASAVRRALSERSSSLTT